MKNLLKYMIFMATALFMYAMALLWVSTIPEDAQGIFHKETKIYPKKYQVYLLKAPIISEVPEKMFQDAEVVIEVATPSQAIEEPKKYLAIIEARKPKMVYFGNMATTGYLATGNPCADGNYPVVGWTVACNDSRLWHRKIYIEGVGTRYVHDTGGMPVNVLDVFVGSLSEAYSITSGSRAVYIVE